MTKSRRPKKYLPWLTPQPGPYDRPQHTNPPSTQNPPAPTATGSIIGARYSNWQLDSHGGMVNGYQGSHESIANKHQGAYRGTAYNHQGAYGGIANWHQGVYGVIPDYYKGAHGAIANNHQYNQSNVSGLPPSPRTFGDGRSGVNPSGALEVGTGGIPAYLVRKPYQVGALGRYGPDGLFDSEREALAAKAKVKESLQHEPVATKSSSATAPTYELPPVSTSNFQADSFIHLNDEEHDGDKEQDREDGEYVEDNGVDEDENVGGCEVAVDNLQDHGQEEKHQLSGLQHPGTPFASRIVPPELEMYKLDFGKYKKRHFKDILSSDPGYLKTIGALLDTVPGDQVKLRAAYEHYCPQFIKKNSAPINVRHPKD